MYVRGPVNELHRLERPVRQMCNVDSAAAGLCQAECTGIPHQELNYLKLDFVFICLSSDLVDQYSVRLTCFLSEKVGESEENLKKRITLDRLVSVKVI